MVKVTAGPDQKALDRIAKALGGVTYQAPTVLKNAANATGRYAMKEIKKTAKESYDFNDNMARFNKALKRKSASYANPRTIISAVSKMGRLSNFVVEPRTVSITGNRPDVYRGHVLKGSSNARLIGPSGNKAFIAQMKNATAGNNHEELVYRSDSDTLRTMYAPSEVKIAQKSWEMAEERIATKLQEYTKQYIQDLLDRRTA